ncbi:hypothetical protein L6164_028774 [Bauhinia variegata]|uniref:Uncharacterized protein n=1 Tax=Bauhinia variegata TaxID=167791 RepID=A0ACB9L7V1_BAUVA|nr:hypothetical protein L6164_028774 [Bauhinia variegata]
MDIDSFPRNPKKEEQNLSHTISTVKSYADEEFKRLDDLEGETLPQHKAYCSELNWDFMESQGFSETGYGAENDDDEQREQLKVIKKENVEFLEEDYEEKMMMTLNLNLNHQEVLDAWSNRGSLLADDYSLSMASYYMGEVPISEEEKARREASVLRYREKRQSRLFSKKIRYQVRKLNADKRPRIKGRFVKRE